jgi:hypothetical protein
MTYGSIILFRSVIQQQAETNSGIMLIQCKIRQSMCVSNTCTVIVIILRFVTRFYKQKINHLWALAHLSLICFCQWLTINRQEIISQNLTRVVIWKMRQELSISRHFGPNIRLKLRMEDNVWGSVNDAFIRLVDIISQETNRLNTVELVRKIYTVTR